tara:strand:+ start:304 stop:576 length:273 start_codon:yes stop_codon:yes gene_type:complete
VKKIRLLKNNIFVTHNTNANTIGELRAELVSTGHDQYSDATVSITTAADQTESVLDSFLIPDAEEVTDTDGNVTLKLPVIAFIPSNKTGG